MTPIPARLMRAQIEACPTRPSPTERDRQRRAYILDAATRVFAAHGRLRVTMKDFATATGLSQRAIRHQVADLDHLFALTLTRHVDTILAAIATVPADRPNLHARRRAEYLRLTRAEGQPLTPIHFLWLRERFALPEDLLEPLEKTLAMIAFMLAGKAGQTALLLLDSPHLDQAQIETLLAAHTKAAAPDPAAQPPSPQPAPPAPPVTPTARPARPRPATIAIFVGTPAALPKPQDLGAIPPRIGQPPPRAAPGLAA